MIRESHRHRRPPLTSLATAGGISAGCGLYWLTFGHHALLGAFLIGAGIAILRAATRP